MDVVNFDALTRRFHSRRTASAGLLGSLVVALGLDAEDASAHNLLPACRKLADTAKRRRCLRRARAHKRNKHSCKPKPDSTFCNNRCGTARNNCRQKVNCTCPAGKSCLSNRGCNRNCTILGMPGDCPSECFCGFPLMEDPTSLQCFLDTISNCMQIPYRCTTNADCQRGFFCGDASCGDDPGRGRCVPNCQI